MTPDYSPLQRAEVELRELRAELAALRARLQGLEQEMRAVTGDWGMAKAWADRLAAALRGD